MRKFLFFYMIFLSFQQILPAQNTFQRVLHFYFKDAAGHKDTIEIRIDTLMEEQFVPFYSQVYYPERFIADTVFAPNSNKRLEVYTLPLIAGYNDPLFFQDLVYGFYPDNYHYFRNVTINTSATGSPYPEPFFFIFRCKPEHWPITMTWDYTYYAGLNGYDALKWAQLLPESVPFTLPDATPGVDFFMDPEKYQCLNKTGTWTFNLGQEENYSVPFAKLFGFMPDVQDTLWSLLMISGGYADCNLVDSNEPTDNQHWSISPNPTDGILNLGIESIHHKDLVIYSIQGQRMPVQFTGATSIDVSSYPPGLYLLEHNDGRRRRWTKFMKL
jgi:hypothetical protein